MSDFDTRIVFTDEKGATEKMNIQNYCKTAQTNALSDDEMKIILMARHEKNSNVRYIQLYQLRQKMKNVLH